MSASKITLLCRTLVFLCLISLAVLPLLFAFGWHRVISQNALDVIELPFHLQPELIQTWQWAAAIVISAIPLVASLIGIHKLKHLMQLFVAGCYFTANTVRALCQFSAWLLTATLLKVMVNPLMSVALTLNNPPGQGALVISINNQTVTSLACCAIFFVIAYVLREGQRIAEENAEIV